MGRGASYRDTAVRACGSLLELARGRNRRPFMCFTFYRALSNCSPKRLRIYIPASRVSRQDSRFRIVISPMARKQHTSFSFAFVILITVSIVSHALVL